jgi:hypothetical protein
MGVSTFMIAENEIVLNTAADAKTGTRSQKRTQSK